MSVNGGTASLARRSAAEAEATRAAILRAARGLFARDGFAHTTTLAIASQAGLTEGALFHHFHSKKGLFRAVFEELEGELDASARAASTAEAPAIERFIAGCRAYLSFVAREDYSRIAMIEAPSVLGRQEWHAVDSGLGLKTVQRGVENLIRTGAISAQPAKPLAVLLLGALNEAGFALARREEGVTVDGTVAVLERLLPRL